MMKPERTTRFKRDFKKLKKKHYPLDLLYTAIQALLNQNQAMLRQLNDHALHGDWHGYRELHPARQADARTRKQFDGWILIYTISNDNLILVLVATGDHQATFRTKLS